MKVANSLPIHRTAWMFFSAMIFLLGLGYFWGWPMTLLVRLITLLFITIWAVFLGWILQFFWGFIAPTPSKSPRQKFSSLRNWSGLIAITWMIGIYEFLSHAPEIFFLNLFNLNFVSWLGQFAYLGIWLGIGLIFAIVGLRSKNLAAQICAIIAICVFILFAWSLLHSPMPAA